MDIILQSTGEHSWNVGEGWYNAANELGYKGKIFKATAKWGASNPYHDDGLLNYLKDNTGEFYLLLGFDWHSQPLHKNKEWREAWQATNGVKIAYLQESILHSCNIYNNDLFLRALESISDLVDGFLFTDLGDRGVLERYKKPILHLPFGVDTAVFKQEKPFESRSKTPFFKGKTTPFFKDSTYAERRGYIDYLLGNNLISVLPYTQGKLEVQDLVDIYNDYKYAINLPSVFSNHPTRVTEAMACGCMVFTNLTHIDEIDRSFCDGEHLVYYNSPVELKEKIARYTADGIGAEIARRGKLYVENNLSLKRQMAEIVNYFSGTC